MSAGETGHQKHYAQAGIEPILAIEAWGLDFCLGNALKYIVRAGHKDGETRLKDLQKAHWYLVRRYKDGHPRIYNQGAGGGVTIEECRKAWQLPPRLSEAVQSIFLASFSTLRSYVLDAANCVQMEIDGL